MLAEPHLRAGAGERAFTVTVLLISTGAFLSLQHQNGANLRVAEGMIASQIGWSVVYLITLSLLIQHCKNFVSTIVSERLLVLLLCLPFLSVLWSDVPALTLRRSVALLGTTMFGLYFATRYDLQSQLKLLSKVCWVAVIGSLIFGTFGLGESADHVPGWYGIFSQKNSLGGMMGLSALIFLLQAKRKTESGPASWVGAGLSVVLLLLSKSVGALVAFLFVIVVWLLREPLRLKTRRHYFAISLAMFSLLVAVYWAMRHMSVFTALMHKDPLLSGRLYVWVFSVVMALRKPWLGYGFDGFWLGPQGPSGRIWVAMNWAAPGAHNGILQILLDLGVVGVAIFFLGFVGYCFRALFLLRDTNAVEVMWPLLFLVYLFGWNITESALLGTNNVFWILYVAVVITLSTRSRFFATPRPAVARNP